MPHKITNEKLYERTELVQWSKIIKERRLRWVGHLMRLPEETPARKSLEEALRPAKRPQGRPKTTWISRTNKDLKEIQPNLNLSSKTLETVANDREQWRGLIHSEAPC